MNTTLHMTKLSAARLLTAPVLVLALLAAAGQAFAQGHPHAMAGEGHGVHMVGRQLEAVGASAEQKAQIQTIMKAARDEMAPQRQQRHALRQQMAGLMAAPVIDARAIEALRQQMVAQHDASSKRRVQALLDAGAVLTPAQRQQMAERMAQRRQMAQRHGDERRALDGARR